jgi:hypothetical protein
MLLQSPPRDSSSTRHRTTYTCAAHSPGKVRHWYGVGMDARAYKARINRARRAAGRQGLTLSRNKTRDPLALNYGWRIYREADELAHLRELDEVERWLADPASR